MRAQPEEMARVAAQTSIPIASGERLATRSAHRAEKRAERAELSVPVPTALGMLGTGAPASPAC